MLSLQISIMSYIPSLEVPVFSGVRDYLIAGIGQFLTPETFDLTLASGTVLAYRG